LRAADIARNAFGQNHIWTAEIYLYIALMHKENSQVQFASPWIRKSFMACYKATGINHKAVKAVFLHLKNIEYNVGSPLANISIEFMASKIKQME